MKKNFATLLFLLATLAASAVDVTLTGAWKVDTETGGTISASIVTLTQNGKDLTGTIKGEDNHSNALTGKVEGQTVTWKYDAEWNGNQLKITYTGTVNEAGGITGSTNVQPMDIEGTFTAKRQDTKEQKK